MHRTVRDKQIGESSFNVSQLSQIADAVKSQDKKALETQNTRESNQKTTTFEKRKRSQLTNKSQNSIHTAGIPPSSKMDSNNEERKSTRFSPDKNIDPVSIPM